MEPGTRLADEDREVRELESFPITEILDGEWLGDLFYRENLWGTGKPTGIIPKKV